MFAELHAIQQEVEALIHAVEAMLVGPRPQPAELAMARLKLTRASTRKRLFLESTVYPALQRLSGADRDALSTFRQEGAAQLRQSAEHIATWTIDAIYGDWAGYQAASAQLRQTMRLRSAEERRVLHPLIERCEALAA